MSGSETHDVARALRQALETDAFLGARAVPVSEARIEELRAMQKESSDESARSQASADADSSAVGGGLSPDEKAERLKELYEEQVRDCVKCHLSETRTKTVFGQGDPDARIMFVGEAPGFEEDRQGLAFVGRAGQLLTAMIERGMGLKREDVFIGNVLKCRPPENRTPSTDEIAACSPYLFQQIEIIEPEVLIALGAPAAQTLLSTRDSIGRLRGRFHDFYPSGIAGLGLRIPIMPTYHPAYLLRSPGEKRKAWEDLKMVMELLGLPIPDQYK
jgi:uracil-DNA glycosylase